jgi:hypothetical protein
MRHDWPQSVKRMIIILLVNNTQTNLIQNQFSIKIIINLQLVINMTAAPPPLYCFFPLMYKFSV